MKEFLLGLSWIFDFFNFLLGGKKGRLIFVNHYIKPEKNNSVLDIGCGTGALFPYLGEVNYDGYDASEKYIDFAIKKYGDKANFFCEIVEANSLKKKNHYDIVIASGLIHHLSDDSVKKLMLTALDALKSGGRFVTLDNVLVDTQSKLARWMILRDRGQYIRNEEDYKNLFKDFFPKVSFDVRSDFIRIPYTHIIAVATKI